MSEWAVKLCKPIQIYADRAYGARFKSVHPRKRMSVAPMRKLIEVALPLEVINRESAREKSIRHGHPSTLHLWWARRPLAAARAVLFAQLVDDPSSHPEQFPSEEAQKAERARLHEIIERLVVWENLHDRSLMSEAHREILKSAGGTMPTILDPFAGGGTIPLEAKRLGLAAWANDLNPLPVLISEVLLRLVDRFDLSAPVSGGLAENAADAMAQDLQYFSRVLERRVESRLASSYSQLDVNAVPLVYFWARTVQCPNPVCGWEVPLVGSWVLETRKGKQAFMRPAPMEATKTFNVDIVEGVGNEPSGSMSRTSGTCPACEASFANSYVKSEGRAGRLGTRLLALQEAHGKTRRFRPATDRDRAAADVETPNVQWLSAELSTHSQYMAPPRYGMTRFEDLFLPRQLRTLVTFVEEIDKLHDELLEEATGFGLVADGTPYAAGSSGALAYADALKILLSIGLARLVNRQSSLCIWDSTRATVQQVFSRQAYSMTWFFAEANPFAGASGSYSGQVALLCKAIRSIPAGTGRVTQSPAQTLDFTADELVVCTDPPYYDNVPYADLSDFFLVWHRRVLGDILPDVFQTMLSPKSDELVADHVRHGGKDIARKFFEQGMSEVFQRIAGAHSTKFPMTIFYAFKQSDESSSGTASTGWDAFLQALVDEGWSIDATWPMRTEQSGGLRELGRNSLASSVVISCRRQDNEASTASRADFLRALRQELPLKLRNLQQSAIAPVDLPQAAIGPGMSTFTRFSRVLESDGTRMTVRSALVSINSVLDEVLNEQEGDFDSTTRFAIAWYRQHGYVAGRFGDADSLARARNTSVEMMARDGILKSFGGKVALLKPIDLEAEYDVLGDSHTGGWEALHHLIRVLEGDGVVAAGAFLASALSRSDNAVDADLLKELAFLLYSVAEKNGWTNDAISFNTLATSWPEIVDASRSAQGKGTRQTTFDFDEMG